MGHSRPTVRDVARQAGVSLGTVSRVLNGVPEVSPDIQKRVKTAIRELGFVPHGVAQSLRSRSSRAVACIIPNIGLPLFSQHVAGAENVLQRMGYSIVLMNTHDDAQRERDAFSLVEQRRLDGVITSITSEANLQFLQRSRETGFPVVLLERDVQGIDSVLADHRAGARKATEYLLALGHRRISLITVTTENWPGRERKAGMSEAYTERGLAPPLDLMFFSGTTIEYGQRVGHHVLTQENRPTAFIVGANQIIGVIRAIRLVGLRIPQDVSLICLGETEFSDVFQPPVTTVRWDLSGLGRMAAEILVSRLSDGRASAQRVILPVELVLRESCVQLASSDSLAPSVALP